MHLHIDGAAGKRLSAKGEIRVLFPAAAVQGAVKLVKRAAEIAAGSADRLAAAGLTEQLKKKVRRVDDQLFLQGCRNASLERSPLVARIVKLLRADHAAVA